MRLERVGVLLLPAEAVLFGHELGCVAHVEVLAGAPQAVVDHGVDSRRVAHTESLASAGQQVRRIGHRFKPAGNNDFGIARGDRLSSERNCLQAGAADHVDGKPRYGVAQATAQSRLPRGVLAKASRKYAAHDALVD